ncbi:hypothetical protein BLOT_012758 [Blomia tropicalis]|nr:hypothetical protein BLOT_012758 [Blomia tropicalis]
MEPTMSRDYEARYLVCSSAMYSRLPVVGRVAANASLSSGPGPNSRSRNKGKTMNVTKEFEYTMARHGPGKQQHDPS